ncbi:alanine/ornithine racemase family PLP-dependent enzyme [Myxococcota bacterium]
MPTPRIEIDLGKIAHNARTLKSLYGAKGIGVIGVTKVVCGDPDIAKTLVDSGIGILADSRTANIQKMRDAGVAAQFLLLRTPLLSQAETVVNVADISLNSELSVVEKLAEIAAAQNTTHKVILMVELGDLREGLMPRDLGGVVQRVAELEGIELAGIGTNLACFAGVKPDAKNMGRLSSIADELEERFDLTFAFVSGGNSANFNWFTSTQDVGRINNLRLGESIYLGRETLQREPIPALFTDAFTLIAEVIEAKTKPSLPHGDIGQDAFGNVPELQDRGQTNRALLGIGLQDVSVSGLTPSRDMDILGASSDHIIVDAKQLGLEVGDEVEFNLNYAALLATMTSSYVLKEYR